MIINTTELALPLKHPGNVLKIGFGEKLASFLTAKVVLSVYEFWDIY